MVRRSFLLARGRADSHRRDHLSDLDGWWPAAQPGCGRANQRLTSQREQRGFDRVQKFAEIRDRAVHSWCIGKTYEELDAKDALATLLSAMASNPARTRAIATRSRGASTTDSRTRRSRARSTIGMRPRTTSAPQIMSMIIATAATPVIAMMMTPVSVRRANRANNNSSPRLAIGVRSTWTCFWAAAIFRLLN
jgi:hypothetical protein